MINEKNKKKLKIIQRHANSEVNKSLIELSKGRNQVNDNIIKSKYFYDGNKVRIIGKVFKEKNRKKCVIIFQNKKYNLKEFIDEEIKTKFIKIKLQLLDSFVNLDSMFKECKSLESLTELSKLKTDKVKSMKDLFNGCSKLTDISDISNWNTKDVKYMNNFFKGCSSLDQIFQNGIQVMFL